MNIFILFENNIINLTHTHYHDKNNNKIRKL